MKPKGPLECRDVKNPDECKRADRRNGFDCLGWSGTTCMDTSATCKDIGLPNLCNNAREKFGLECAGWGGTQCLEKDDVAEPISLQSSGEQGERRD